MAGRAVRNACARSRSPAFVESSTAPCPAHFQALSGSVHGPAQAVCGRALAPGPLAGCARCAQDGLPALVLADPETLPARCEALLGLPVGHLADLLHSRFEQLVAMAAPEAIERWADDDIALRARCLRAVSRAMLARRFGRCVFVSSSAAQRPSPGQGWYAAAKLAGEGLYRSLGVELAGRGLSACSVRLSWLDAGRGHEFLFRHGQVARAMPAGRCLGPDDVLPGLCFLLSAEAAAINGSVVTLDGGLGALKLPEL